MPEQAKAFEHLRDLVQQAEGNPEAIQALREFLDRTPGLWQSVGNLAKQAEQALLDLACGQDSLTRECLQHQMQELKDTLGGETPSQLENLLIERIAANWLHAWHADLMVVRAQEGDVRCLWILQKRAQQANKTLQIAVKHLAAVRKLLGAGSRAAAPGISSPAAHPEIR